MTRAEKLKILANLYASSMTWTSAVGVYMVIFIINSTYKLITGNNLILDGNVLIKEVHVTILLFTTIVYVIKQIILFIKREKLSRIMDFFIYIFYSMPYTLPLILEVLAMRVFDNDISFIICMSTMAAVSYLVVTRSIKKMITSDANEPYVQDVLKRMEKGKEER